MSLLETTDLEKHFKQSSGILPALKAEIFSDVRPKVRAVDGVDLDLQTNQVQGIIGESGCGKTTLLHLLAGLEEPTSGEIQFRGERFSKFKRKDWQQFRRNAQIILQDPFNSLDPKFTVREAIHEPLSIHGFERKNDRISEALEKVNLTPPERYMDQKPEHLSGGEKQRVSIARAIVIEPDIILADEPVSMLDVSIQASILGLLRDLADTMDLSMVYISHDLSTVSYICDRVNVMYLGRIVESAPTETLLEDPKHPYTQALINSIPVPDPHHTRERTELEGSPSDPIDLPQGCRFKDRCPERMEKCDITPEFLPADSAEEHYVACHLYNEYTDNDIILPSSTAEIPDSSQAD
jgi:peptide/nickel transport system ATP-binding protein